MSDAREPASLSQGWLTDELSQAQPVEGEILGRDPAEAFAIIGTREPDAAQLEVAKHLAFAIAWIGNKIVRTGAANGIDEQAMVGTQGKNLEVYLPWATYNRGIIPLQARRIVYNPAIHTDWADSVTRYHPAGSRLSRGEFALHARNFGIVRGCRGVLALPDSNGRGGTSQGIRIATALKIPLVQGNKGSITDVPRFIAAALQKFGLVSKDLRPTLLGGRL